jgi:hypothetical protein
MRSLRRYRYEVCAFLAVVGGLCLATTCWAVIPPYRLDSQ